MDDRVEVCIRGQRCVDDRVEVCIRGQRCEGIKPGVGGGWARRIKV